MIKKIVLMFFVCFYVKANEIKITFENDILFQSDQSYTHGTLISYTHEINNIKDIIFDRNILARKYSIGQYIYTPKDILSFNLVENDRPYAGLLYLDYKTIIDYDDSIISYGVLVGIIGEYSFADKTQIKVHDWLNSKEPNGWDNQLNNEIVCNLSLYNRKIYYYDIVEFLPYYGVAIGNLNSQLNGGIVLRNWVKNFKNYDFITIEPFPKEFKSKSINVSFFIGIDFSLIWYNVVLDGNMFSDSHKVDKNYFVSEIFSGFDIISRSIKCTFSIHARSKEYKQQEDIFKFGSLSIAYLF
jgi:lipid A 3-O-deacylase